VKPLLYVLRVLLTGIHLMRTGEVEANLLRLNEEFKLPYIPDLVEQKVAGAEHSAFMDGDLPFYQREYERLRSFLDTAYRASDLPEVPSGKAALNEVLVQLRLNTRK
jgi:hypothetical protein